VDLDLASVGRVHRQLDPVRHPRVLFSIPDLISLLAMAAPAVPRQPLDGHRKRLFPGDGDIAGGVRSCLLNNQPRLGCQRRHLVCNHTLVDPVVLLLQPGDGEGALVLLVSLLGQVEPIRSSPSDRGGRTSRRTARERHFLADALHVLVLGPQLDRGRVPNMHLHNPRCAARAVCVVRSASVVTRVGFRHPVDEQGPVGEGGDLVHIEGVEYPLVLGPRDELEGRVRLDVAVDDPAQGQGQVLDCWGEHHSSRIGDFKDGWGVLGSADAVGDLADVRARVLGLDRGDDEGSLWLDGHPALH